MNINGQTMLKAAPIRGMAGDKIRLNGVSHGLSEAGYDIRIRQHVRFFYRAPKGFKEHVLAFFGVKFHAVSVNGETHDGRFCIASAVEEFDLPADLTGVVHDKSTHARRGLSVFNTVIEPGFQGGLTLELVYHGQDELELQPGIGIAQVIFTRNSDLMKYTGKYQGQSLDPVAAIYEK